MKLLFKQRFFSWFDSYDIFDENGQTVYTVEGKLAWGHRLHILDRDGNHIGTVKQRVFTFMPKFELYEGDECLGTLEKEPFTFFKSRYYIDFNGWQIEGQFMEWDYSITDQSGREVAVISKELFNWTDTYAIDVDRDEDALIVLMIVLAIDAAKCSAEK